MLVYTLNNVRINDSWYCKDGDMYHSFFLEYACDLPPQYRATRQSIGHMYSKDLLHWEYAGVVLQPEPGTWNDAGLATGSIVKYEEQWYMLYTANSTASDKNGIGLAVSDDLMTWKRVGDGPVLRKDTLYPFQQEGETVMCRPLADPYIYPEPIDGYYYIYINSYAVDYPINHRGTTTIFKTRDFKEYVPHNIAVRDICDRMETVQVWKHGERFYMYAGVVTMQQDERDFFKMKQENTNHLFVADNVDGPYVRCQKLQFPDDPEYPGRMYIAKVLQDPKGKDVMLINNMPHGVEGPYDVEYLEDGTIQLK